MLEKFNRNIMSAKQIAEILLDKKAVKLSFDPPFTYTSGMKAPIYTDNRVLISYPEERKIIVNTFCEIVDERKLKVDCVAGTATAGIPWAAFVADKLMLPMIYIRPQKKEHGGGKQIEGVLPEGSNVLVVEDLITTGGSSIASVKSVREEGKSNCDNVLAIFTYGFQKSKDAFSEAGCGYTALCDFDTLLEVALERGYVTKDEYAKILEYKKDPPSWAEKMGF